MNARPTCKRSSLVRRGISQPEKRLRSSTDGMPGSAVPMPDPVPGEGGVEVLPREFVERIARIVGPNSAAAQALACADRGEHGDRPVFCRPVGSGIGDLMVTSAGNLSPLRVASDALSE